MLSWLGGGNRCVCRHRAAWGRPGRTHGTLVGTPHQRRSIPPTVLRPRQHERQCEEQSDAAIYEIRAFQILANDLRARPGPPARLRGRPCVGPLTQPAGLSRSSPGFQSRAAPAGSSQPCVIRIQPVRGQEARRTRPPPSHRPRTATPIRRRWTRMTVRGSVGASPSRFSNRLTTVLDGFHSQR